MVEWNVRQAHIAKNIRQLREEAGLRQQDIADAIGLSVSQYTRLELGKKRLYVDVLLAVAEALNADPAEIIREKLRPQDERRAAAAVRTGGAVGAAELLEMAQRMIRPT